MSAKQKKAGDLQGVLAWHGSVGSEGTGEESNVIVLVTGNLGESPSDPVWVTGSSKVLLGELGKSVGANDQIWFLKGKKGKLTRTCSRGARGSRRTGGQWCHRYRCFRTWLVGRWGRRWAWPWRPWRRRG
jgi:hypothetical protein